jgi:molybdate transport system substrate-binding protein
MTQPMPDRPRRTRPVRTPRARHLVALAVVAVLLASCSDAHSSAAKDQAEGGTDPRVVTVFQPPELLPAVKALAIEFGRDHPEVAFVYSTGTASAQRQKVDGGALPSIWIDLAATIDTYATDSRTQAPPFDLGTNVLQFVVKDGNPLRIHSLGVFGPNSGPYPGARTGLCKPDIRCGAAASKYLTQQGVDATPTMRSTDGDELANAIVGGTLDAALVYRTSSAPLGAQLDVEPLDPPSAGVIDYHLLRMTSSATAAEFETWLSTDAAKAVLTAQGLLPVIAGAS